MKYVQLGVDRNRAHEGDLFLSRQKIRPGKVTYLTGLIIIQEIQADFELSTLKGGIQD